MNIKEKNLETTKANTHHTTSVQSTAARWAAEITGQGRPLLRPAEPMDTTLNKSKYLNKKNPTGTAKWKCGQNHKNQDKKK
jgi:hypothetical protein